MSRSVRRKIRRVSPYPILLAFLTVKAGSVVTFSHETHVGFAHNTCFGPVVRPAVLTGFHGYVFLSPGLLDDLGPPWRDWHALVYWNPHSMMFEMAWCVMLYTNMLWLEFATIASERPRIRTAGPHARCHRARDPVATRRFRSPGGRRTRGGGGRVAQRPTGLA